MMRKLMLVGVGIAVAVVAFVFAGSTPTQVYAQVCPPGVTCADLTGPESCDQCGGRLYCTCACDVLCPRPNNCACEATLCWYQDGSGAWCDKQGCPRDIYDNCPNCQVCGGIPENCAFDCPDWINPCITDCDAGGVTPTPAPTPPPGLADCAAPTGLAGGASCDGSDGLIDITWTWTGVAGATNYLINVDNDSDFSSPEVSAFTGDTNYTTANLAPGTWYARVRVNTSDGVTCAAPSTWSTSASATNACTACAAPVNNIPTSACISQTTYNVTWRFNESAGANTYQLVVSTQSGANFFLGVVYDSGWQSSAFFSCAAGSCSLPMTGFTSGTTYYNLVRARGVSCPQSAWSNQQSAFQNCFVACPAPGSLTGAGACDVSDGLLDISWTWGAVTGATAYRLQVDDDPAYGTPIFNGTTAATSQATNNLTPGTWYARVRVETDNGIACTAPSVWTATSTYTNACLATVEGTIYDDPLGQATINLATGICEYPGVPPPTAANSGIVTIDDDLGGAWTGTVGGAGTYTASGVPVGTNRYDATFSPSGGWVCMCPAPDPGNPGSCFPYTNFIDAPMTGVNFFASTVRTSWFQTVGGDVHAEGTINSAIPDTCAAAPACEPYFSLPGGDEVGVVSSSGGLGNYGSGSVSEPATRGWEAVSAYQGPAFTFDFWRRESPTPTPLADLNNRPSPPEGVYEVTWSGSDLTLSGNWNNIPGAGPLTIFVNFDNPSRTLFLNPNPPGITLDPGSPLALVTIITNGNIRVGDTVTRLEGIFMSDGQFRTCTSATCGYDAATGTTYQLNLIGSVIAWGGVDMQRDLFVANRDTPAELLTYEPKFVQRLPEFMLRAIYTWKEVAP